MRCVKMRVVGLVLALCGASSAMGQLLGANGAGGSLLRIDTATAVGTIVGPTGSEVIGALAWDGNTLFASSVSTGTLQRINPLTGAGTVIGVFSNPLLYVHGLAYDSVHDVLYGLGNDDFPSAQSHLLMINRTTAAITVVGTNTLAGIGGDLAYDPATDKLYMSHVGPGGINQLFSMNRTTGIATAIGAFGVGDQVGNGMTFDPVLGLLASDNGGTLGAPQTLYRVNPTTGAATLVGTITQGSNVLGLAVIPAPGTMMMAGAAGLLASRRRRDQDRVEA